VGAAPLGSVAADAAGDEQARFDEAKRAIDMAIGDVEPAHAGNPDHSLHAEYGLEVPFDVGAGDTWIAVVVDPAAFGQQQGAVAVIFDAAAFATDRGDVALHAEMLSNLAGDAGIAGMRLLVAPAIEAEIHGGDRAVLGTHEGALTSRFTETQQREGGIEYNYRREAGASLIERDTTSSQEPGGEGPVAEMAAMSGTDVATYTRERPGMSAFALEDGVVYHAYSTYARGLDGLWAMYQWLDRAPKGRNETGIWWRRHDEYGKQGTSA